MAQEIALLRPHLIGLQEVLNLTVNGQNLPSPSPFRDYPDDLLDALDAQGLDYRVAGMVENIDAQVPLNIDKQPGLEIVGITHQR